MDIITARDETRGLMRESKNQGTKAALLGAAERLFAEKGLGGVSVRDITRAAGARNESALHYHFGSMEALIREVFEHRYREIEKARLARLAEIDAAEKGDDLETLLRAAIAPLFEACKDAEGRLYARFCVQLVSDPRFDLIGLIQDAAMSSVLVLAQRLRMCLRDIPPSVLVIRLRRLFTFALLLTAEYAREIEAGTAPPLKSAIGEAVASLSGFMKAPPSRRSR